MWKSPRGPWLALVMLIVCLVPAAATAQTAQLAWDPSPDASGYRVKWGTSVGSYPNSLDAGNMTETPISGLTPGSTYWAVVEAYDADRQFSTPSSPLEFTVPVPCTYAINPANHTIHSGATEGTIFVTTGAGCPWTATSTSEFLLLENVGARTGPGSVAFRITTNAALEPRVGTANIAGLTLTIGQHGSSVGPEQQKGRENARADFNADGFNDLLWQDSTNGYLAAWTLQGGHTTKNAVALSHRSGDPDWRIVGTGDFNSDGRPDIVWHHRKHGAIYLWYMDGVTRIGETAFSIEGIRDARWKIAGVGDFNGDNKPDLVWQHDTAGWLVVWLMDGVTLLGGREMTPDRVDVEWKIAGVADLNADGKTDLVWRNRKNGQIGAWLMDGVQRITYVPLNPGTVEEQEWQIASIIDVDGDQSPDLVWHHATSGWVAVWYLSGTTRVGANSFPIAIETNWKIVGPK